MWLYIYIYIYISCENTQHQSECINNSYKTWSKIKTKQAFISNLFFLIKKMILFLIF
jgi:hypothetical protein